MRPSARALSPRRSPRRRHRATAPPRPPAARAPIGSAAGAGPREPAPRVQLGAPRGRGRTCRGSEGGPTRLAPRRRCLARVHGNVGAGPGRAGVCSPYGSGAFLALRALARKAGPWTRRRTLVFGARSPPLDDPTHPAARPPPGVPLLLSFYSNGREAGSELDSGRARPPGLSGSCPAARPRLTPSMVPNAQWVEGRAPNTSKNSGRETAGSGRGGGS